jgi:hypothetical protein
MTAAKAIRIVGAKDLLLYTFTKQDIMKPAERLERDHLLAELKAALYGITMIFHLEDI